MARFEERPPELRVVEGQAQQAAECWLDRSRRCSRAQPKRVRVTEDRSLRTRLFLFRLLKVHDFHWQKPGSVEAKHTLALQLRLDFLCLPSSGLPELCGCSAHGPKAAVQESESRRESHRSTNLLLGTTVEPPQLFCFRVPDAGRGLQLLVEVRVVQQQQQQQQQHKQQSTSATYGDQALGEADMRDVGWGLVRLDLAGDPRPGAKMRLTLRVGSLFQHLRQQPGSATTGPVTGEGAFVRSLERLGAPGGPAAAGVVEYELEALPMQEAAEVLLPPCFPMAVGGNAGLGGLGGLSCQLSPSGRLVCAGDLDGSARLRLISVRFPAGPWLEAFLGSVRARELLELHLLVGTHNALRWLNAALKSRQTEGTGTGCSPHESGCVWQLQLQREDSHSWRFSGEVPVDFVRDADCAILLELLATVSTSADGDQRQNHGVGWQLLLPRYHATQQAPDSVHFQLPLRHGPESSFMGHELRHWRAVEQALQQQAQSAVNVNVGFALASQGVAAWLRGGQAPPRPLHAGQPHPASPGPQAPRLLPAQTPGSCAASGPAAAQTPPAAPAPVPASSPHTPRMVARPLQNVHLRDQATQSDPPSRAIEEDVMGEGLPASKFPHLLTGKAEAASRSLEATLRPDVATRLLWGAQQRLPPKELSWHLEDEDALQADEISLEFLSFRAAPSPSSNTSGAAERVKFRARFFLFPPLETAVASLASYEPGVSSVLRSSATQERLALVYHLDGAACTSMTPGVLSETPMAPISRQGAAKEVHRRLVSHLALSQSQVELWSVDSAMQLGVAVIPLDGLLRQGRPFVQVSCERPVLDPVSGETHGFLSLLLGCRGRPHQHVVTPTDCNAGSHNALPAPVKALGHKKRHKARTLLAGDAGGQGSQQRSAVALDDVLQKQLRLKQLNALRQEHVEVQFSDQVALLTAADELRQRHKHEEIARRMDQFNTSQVTLVVPFASACYFHVEIVNPCRHEATFQVVVLQPGATNSGIEELGVAFQTVEPASGVLSATKSSSLALVREPEEWRRLVASRQVPPPPAGNFALLATGPPTGPGGVLFQLGAQQSACLPFRYLALENPGGADLETRPARREPLSLAELERSLSEEPEPSPSPSPSRPGCSGSGSGSGSGSRRRHFFIEVSMHRQAVVRRVEVRVRPLPCPVGQTLRFFEAEGVPLEKSLPAPPAPGSCQGTGTGIGTGTGTGTGGLGRSSVLSGPYACSTRNEVHMHWMGPGRDELCLRFLAPRAAETLAFYVIFYADPHFHHVLTTTLVEVQGFRSERVLTKVGQSVERSICLAPAELQDARTVRLFSSSPGLARVPVSVDVDQYGAKFAAMVSSTSVGVHSCRLHAIDTSTRRVAAALLLLVEAQYPDVKVVHEVVVPSHASIQKRLPYRNEAAVPMRYSVRSSDPSLVQVQNPEWALAALDTTHVSLLFHGRPASANIHSSTSEVFLFLASEDRAIQDIRLLRITYT